MSWELLFTLQKRFKMLQRKTKQFKRNRLCHSGNRGSEHNRP